MHEEFEKEEFLLDGDELEEEVESATEDDEEEDDVPLEDEDE